METKKHVVIIGAGVGGIATAVQLARQGYRVSVYEKLETPGGRCGRFIKDGHRFDIGATIFLMPSIYKEVFDSLGLDMHEFLDTKPLPIIYKLFYGNGKTFDFTTDERRMKAQMERIEKGSYEAMKRYIADGYAMFRLSMEKLLGRNFYKAADFINLSNLGLLVKIRTHIRHMQYIRRFFKNPLLQVAFTFQNIYVGQNPFKAPALFAMLPAAELTEGSVYPAGGMFQVVEKLLGLATELGVEFHYNKTAVRIETESQQAKRVIFEDGSSAVGDLFVANADLPYIYKELLPQTTRTRKLDFMSYSCSAIVFHWAMDKTYPAFAHHSVFLAGDYKGSLDRIFNDKTIADSPSFYIHAPLSNDPDVAPEGQDTISAIVPCGHLDIRKKQDWDELCRIARKGILERLESEGFVDFEKHIKFEICYTPQTWNKVLNVARGSVFGSISHSIFQMGYFRPHNRHAKYKNLYFAGGSTHPGNGVPLVLLASKLTTERILKEQKA